IHFGPVKIGITSLEHINIANPEHNKVSALITGIAFRSGGNGFAVDQSRTTCMSGGAIAPGKACRIAITFTPPGLGTFADNVIITGDFTNSGALVGLHGTGR
ncbi:MAG TPA: hypothetical protein VMT64_02475, partial [Candidatus Binataceae bacterium]|nr:hypothetical protein [Candidatus Binataceae bacterium]